MAQLFAFFCGGSGTRVAEIFTLCTAMGLMKHDIQTNICICDADTNNGNKSDAQEMIENYQNVHDIMYPEGTATSESALFGTPIELKTWHLDGPSDGSTNYHLDDLAKTNDGILVKKALFSADESSLEIKGKGFCAHPNLGNAYIEAAILHEKDAQNTVYSKTKERIRQQIDGNNEVYVVVVGSLFGGTGAACMPTIAKDIKENIKDYCEQKNKNFDDFFHMCAVMLLPYFSLPIDKGATDDEKIADQFVDTGNFDTSTKSAVSYYFHNHKDLFDAIYPIGLPTSYVLPGKRALGGNAQKNPTSLVEWNAALAIRHFIDNHQNDRPAQSALWCAPLKVDMETGRYLLSKDAFMVDDFDRSLNRWNEFAAFYALYLYPNILMGNAGCKDTPNWYEYAFSKHAKNQEEEKDATIEKAKKAENDAVESLLSFVKQYYAILGDLIGLRLTDGQPDNQLINANKLVQIFKKTKVNEKGDNLVEEGILSQFVAGKDESKEQQLINRHRKAYDALGIGFSIPQKQKKFGNKPYVLERAVTAKKKASGSFGQLLLSLTKSL